MAPGLSQRHAVQNLGIPGGKNFDLSWDFPGREKSCPDKPGSG
jgi:hypothetical protein